MSSYKHLCSGSSTVSHACHFGNIAELREDVSWKAAFAGGDHSDTQSGTTRQTGAQRSTSSMQWLNCP